jgi:hypothetical protein
VRDPHNPTDAELRGWATTDEVEPVIDFDLMVADVARVDLLVELLGSPKRPFFLRCLYLVVGDAVRTDFHTASRAGLEDALERAGDRARDDVALAKWVADSRTLIARPETFDYSAWCEGGLAREALAVS